MLHLNHVAKAFGQRWIFKNVTADFPSGSISLVTGSNGAGKSTLLKIIAGLMKPTSGTIRCSDDVRTGYLGHATFLYPALTALENLRFWQAVNGLTADSQTLLAMLEHVGLENSAYVRAGVFSRGMMQRLNLARVLLQKPDLFLLDEPSTGLDTASQKLLRAEILAARKRGACVIMVSHDIKQDRALADKTYSLTQRKMEDLPGD